MKNTLTSAEQKSISYYDTHAEEWVQKHGSGRHALNDLQDFFKLVPSGKVLEVGVGSGVDATKLIRHFGVNNYIGVEPAKGLLEITKKRNRCQVY